MIAAIEDVVGALVETHQRMEKMHSEMQIMMMSHMAEHMAEDKDMKSMMMCPMMQGHESAAEGEQHNH